jgi:hypothetical protein
MERPKIVRLLVKEILFGEDTITHFVIGIPIPSLPSQNGVPKPKTVEITFSVRDVMAKPGAKHRTIFMCGEEREFGWFLNPPHPGWHTSSIRFRRLETGIEKYCLAVERQMNGFLTRRRPSITWPACRSSEYRISHCRSKAAATISESNIE